MHRGGTDPLLIFESLFNKYPLGSPEPPGPLARQALADRMQDTRRARRGLAAHSDYEAFARDGFLRKDLAALLEAGVLQLLRMVSGEEVLGIPARALWKQRDTAHTAGDPQYEKHFDNWVGPIFKVWVYPGSTTLADGPLHYIRGWCQG